MLVCLKANLWKWPDETVPNHKLPGAFTSRINDKLTFLRICFYQYPRQLNTVATSKVPSSITLLYDMMSSKNKTQYSCSSQKSYKSGKGADCPVNELCCMLIRDLSFTDFQMCIFEWTIVFVGFLFLCCFCCYVCLLVLSFFCFWCCWGFHGWYFFVYLYFHFKLIRRTVLLYAKLRYT